MKRTIFLSVLFVMFFAGCFHEWPDSKDVYYRVLDGPIVESGDIDVGFYQNCIKCSYIYVDISSNNPLVLFNGEKSITVGSNGNKWVAMDVTELSPGDSFEVYMNDDVLSYEVF